VNLRAFHAFLIFMSAALAALFGIWCLSLYSHDGGVLRLVGAIVSFAVSAGLVIYDSWFLRKTRALR
jgi:hypothetical protein